MTHKKITVIVCNDSTLENAKAYLSTCNKESFLFQLKNVFKPKRADYLNLVKTIKESKNPTICELFLFDEFNPTHDLLVEACNSNSNVEIKHPTKMPTQASLHGVDFEYTRRILPYPGPKVDVKIASKVLGEISSIFIASGLYWHVCFGTLLGLVREKSIFPWDTDVDLITNGASIPKFTQLFPQIIDCEFEIARINPQMITFWKNGTGIDLYTLNIKNKFLTNPWEM